MSEENMMYVHSRCCNSPHWELSYNTETHKYELRCPKCKTPVDPRITVTGPVLDNCECEECKKEVGKKKSDG
jgi:NAD-dependent SIR2 family protein deacetylase